MTTHNPDNERIKRQYFAYLKEAKRQSETTIDAVAMALARFEADTRQRSFKSFHIEQAIAFKEHMANRKSQVTGDKMSKATLHATFAHLKRFFQWLAGQPGYKSHIRYSDAEYFNLSDKDSRVATAPRQKPFPTLEQIKRVIELMPYTSDIERRNRVLMAFIILTGARDSAVASMRLKHVDLVSGCVHQDAREVHTKFSKTFTTYFFPVGDDIRQILIDWVTYLRDSKLWGNDDPLFPSTHIALGASLKFEAAGLSRSAWRSTAPIREIFRDAFQAAALPYFNPHSFRKTLVQLGQRTCKNPEDFKAWSQNLGHEGVLTTFYSYGEIGNERQAEIIRGLGESRPNHADVAKRLQECARELERLNSSR
jgi:integrase